MPLLTADADLRALLERTRVIAVVGHSADPSRTSYRIAAYLRRAGYTVYPVNPTVETIDGQPCYPSLAAVPEPIDLVDVFRRSVSICPAWSRTRSRLARKRCGRSWASPIPTRSAWRKGPICP